MRSTTPLAALLLGLTAVLQPAISLGCTTFCLREPGQTVFGRNYDWSFGDGLLIVNQRNVSRVTGTRRPADQQLRWKARYGSVTFNQFGRDFPTGGINEAGLVVELMWLEAGRYPTADHRPSIGSLHWIQYQLDTAATVDQVIASDQDLRISASSPLHYLVADAEGRVATIEFLDGELVSHSGAQLPVAALANDTYQRSLTVLEDSSTRRGPFGTTGSLRRFRRAADRVSSYPEGHPDPVGYAFETLEQVAQPGATWWSVVYELEQRRLHFHTQNHSAIRFLDLDDLDFSCQGEVLIVDLLAPLEGDLVPRLLPYTEKANEELVRGSYSKVDFLAGVPEASLLRTVRYPTEHTHCRE